MTSKYNISAQTESLHHSFKVDSNVSNGLKMFANKQYVIQS